MDKDYLNWVKELSLRYRSSQIKDSVKVNNEMLRFNWELGRDIVKKHIEERLGDKVIDNLSIDLQKEMRNVTGFSRRNIYYCKQFYELYSQSIKFMPQLEAQLQNHLFSIPWGHHKFIMDKCKVNKQKL